MNQVNTDNLTRKFNDHLEDDHNQNIFFSGKYGIGKTTFLKSYFDSHSNYFTIFLSPVNYSVSSNEDIFELIKIDIIKQLFIQEKIKNLVNDVGSLETIKVFAKKNPLKLVQLITNTLAKLHPIAEVIASTTKSVYELLDEFEKLQEKLNESAKDDGKKMLDYASDFSNQKGTYVEYDVISQLLYNSIRKISENQKTVLIIDDMDRLDPEHIFRIMNIFSAHHGDDFGGHKFGFEKVVLVADIENIEKLFHYKYGPEVDFDGYIDKFYSKEIFVFNNDANLHEFIVNEIELDLPTEYMKGLSFLLSYFIKAKKIKLRNIIKYEKTAQIESFEIHRKNFRKFETFVNIDHLDKTKDVYILSKNIFELEVIRYLIIIFGSVDNLMDAIVEMKSVDEIINETTLAEILPAFVLLEKLVATNSNDLERYFYKVKFSDQIGRPVIDANYPEVNFLNHNWRLIFIWSSKNRYIGNDCFYKNLKPMLKSEKSTSVSYAKLGEMLESHLNFVLSKDWVRNMKISSF